MSTNKIKFISYLSIVLFFSSYISYNLAASLGSFVDEYASIASIVKYFKTLKLDAGFLGGPYSVQLTSGPISGVGFFIGWELTKNFFIARTSNVLFIFLILASYLFVNNRNYDEKVYLASFSALFVIPWWYGVLYSLGEIVSTLFFMFGIFNLGNSKKYSMLFFSISIFFGKIILILPFLGLLLIELISTENKKGLLLSTPYFFIPFIFHIIPVNAFYHAGNLIDYYNDFFDLLLSHKGAGIETLNKNIFEKIINSEFSQWNFIVKFRILISPLIFLLFLYKNKEQINGLSERLFTHIGSCTIILYLWFWLISETKWLRYSQHFIVLVIYLTLFLVFNKNFKLDNLDTILLFLIIFPFLSNIYVILISFSLFGYLLIKNKNNLQKDRILSLICMILFLNSIYLSSESYTNKIYTFNDGNNTIFQECLIKNTGEECKNNYLGEI
tara:strand:- start:44 stop:1372 length:1329 start_codon:yes stop_codon:yes gene_type:complete